MEEIRLGEYVNIKTGKLDANAASSNGKYPFFTCSNEPLKINNYSYDCECVLVAGNGDLNVKYYNGKFDAYQRTYIIEPKNRKVFNTKYLYYLINSNIEQLRRNAIGGVIKYIKLGNLTNIEFFQIDIKKQNNIVNTLDKVQEIIDIRKKQIEELNKLIKSQFVEMFGDPFKNPNEYEFIPFGNFMERCVDIGSNGANKTIVEHLNMKDTEDYAMLIRTINFTSNDFKHNMKYIDKESYEFFAKSKVYGGEIIFNKIGSAGINFIVPKFHRPVSLGLNIIMVTPKEINTRYLYELLNSEYGKYQINLRVNGAVTKSIQKTELKKIPIMYPNIELQNEFNNIVNRIDKQKFEIQKSLEEMEKLQESLMNKYFG